MPHSLIEYYLAHPWHLHGGTMLALDHMLAAHVERRDVDAGELREILGQDFAGRELGRAQDADALNDHLLPSGIAVVSVRGVLARHADQVNGLCMPRGRSYETIGSQLLAARDAGARAAVLRIESPGGIAIGAQECAEVIASVRADGLPVYAYVDGYAYSAGYYLAAACDEIVLSSRAASTGSIGTVMALWDRSEAATRAGMRRVVLRSGPRKALGQDGEQIDEEVIADLQERIDSFFSHFRGHVLAGRNLTPEQLDPVADGRVLDAEPAIAAGLADAVASWQAFITTIAQNYGDITMSLFRKTPPAEGQTPPAEGQTPPAESQTPPAEGQTPTVAAITAPEAIALSQQYPGAAATIAQLATEGQSQATIELAAAKAALDAERKEHATTREQLATASAKQTAAKQQLEQALKLGPQNMGTETGDAGGDFTQGGGTPAASAGEAELKEFFANTPAAQEQYAIGGADAFVANCAAGADSPANYA